MVRKAFFIVIFLGAFGLQGQNAISGYIDLKGDGAWDKKVYLEKIDGKELPVAISKVDKEGYFYFQRKHISHQNTMYRIYIDRVQGIIDNSGKNDKFFILSKVDSVYFAKGTGLFSGYRNSSTADAEWRRLQKFESSLKQSTKNQNEIDSSAYAIQMKSYTKDSLEILMVKLIGIKQLENKDLLEKDIAKNPEYYLALLEELRTSGIERTQYLFLERKLAYLTQDIVENKYQLSKAFNVLLGAIITGLIFFIVRLKRKVNSIPVDLSKQEKNVHDLILQGKSNKEIANELFISLSTVKTHITNIYGKLKVSNRQELLRKIRN